MSMQALKDSLLAGGLGDLGGIPIIATGGPRPQQQLRGRYNMQVLNHKRLTSVQGLRAAVQSVMMAVSKRLDYNDVMTLNAAGIT